MFYLPRFVASLSFLSLFVLTRCVNAYGIESYTFSPSIVKESALATDVDKNPGQRKCAKCEADSKYAKYQNHRYA